MRSFLISDNKDTLIGMRLVGIEGVIVHTKEKVLEEINKVFKDDTIGVLILTERIVDLAPEEIMEFKFKKAIPMIIEIPDRHGTIREGDNISKYIKNSVGIKI
ncbi:MAG: ATP synthase subunit F [Epulopiscium sp. Nele67-Bin001]|nr:MAG: ATP synthase subunit F [Epulopiscium sp. Nuni2H_MBin001]OON90234.1 MAG: ATP synthase subunit F [Epulopiscium sp. Nele67-Bin001]